MKINVADEIELFWCSDGDTCIGDIFLHHCIKIISYHKNIIILLPRVKFCVILLA
jgi:hypothetical protein